MAHEVCGAEISPADDHDNTQEDKDASADAVEGNGRVEA